MVLGEANGGPGGIDGFSGVDLAAGDVGVYPSLVGGGPTGDRGGSRRLLLAGEAGDVTAPVGKSLFPPPEE